MCACAPGTGENASLMASRRHENAAPVSGQAAPRSREKLLFKCRDEREGSSCGSNDMHDVAFGHRRLSRENRATRSGARR